MTIRIVRPNLRDTTMETTNYLLLGILFLLVAVVVLLTSIAWLVAHA